MQYCSEGDLQKLIESQPDGLSSFEFSQFFHHLVSAVKHLHEKCIIHRDIKPANIMISEPHEVKKVHGAKNTWLKQAQKPKKVQKGKRAQKPERYKKENW